MLSYIKNHTDLFMTVLCFETLDLDSIHKRLSTDGIEITKPKLLEIFDSEFLFVSRGMEAKAKRIENKKINPKPSRYKNRR